jgi:hypothetical protein
VFSAGVVNDLEEHRFASAVVHGFPLVPERVIHDVEDNNRTGLGVLTDIMLMALPWPIFGLAGGLAIDRRWGGKVHSVGLSMCAVAVLYTVILWLSNQLRVGGEMLSHVSVAAGWGLALSVCPCSGILMPSDAAPELARQT